MPGRRSGRFERCVAKVRRRGGVQSPEAVCAASLRRTGWAPGRGNPEKENPADVAADLSEEFHGRASVPELVEDKVHVHEHLAGLGMLNEIKLRGGIKIRFDGATRLASNEDGTQLFIVGGDQSVDLAEWPDVDESKELVNLGKVAEVVYTTDKQHLGREDRKPGAYKHQLGEKSGDLPELVYSTRDGRMQFVGGHYKVTWRGIED